MRSLAVALFVLIVGSLLTIGFREAGGQGSDTRTGPTANQPAVIAVKFHADWCSTCRRMGTVFEDLAIVAEDEPALFVNLDLTDRRVRTQAGYLMTMLGLQEAWNQAGAGEKTGFILVVDARSREPVGTLTADQDLKQMKAALLDMVAKVRS